MGSDVARRLPPLSSVRAFEAAARHGSFKQAANELGVTPTAISHQIRSLENHTGITLFERRTRLVVLTEPGEQLYRVVRDGFDAIAAVLDHLARRRKRSQVTVSTTPAFAAKWLIPRMSHFQEHHGDIDLQLHTSNEPVSLIDGNVDLAIRYGEGPFPDLEAEMMFADGFAPVVNPKLGVRRVSDFGKVPLIHFEWKRKHPRNPSWERWFAQAGVPYPTSPSELRFSDENYAIQAAVAAQGIALASLALVAEELEAGQLVRPFPEIISGHAYHIVRSTGAVMSQASIAVVDWLRFEIAAREGASKHVPLNHAGANAGIAGTNKRSRL